MNRPRNDPQCCGGFVHCPNEHGHSSGCWPSTTHNVVEVSSIALTSTDTPQDRQAIPNRYGLQSIFDVNRPTTADTAPASTTLTRGPSVFFPTFASGDEVQTVAAWHSKARMQGGREGLSSTTALTTISSESAGCAASSTNAPHADCSTSSSKSLTFH